MFNYDNSDMCASQFTYKYNTEITKASPYKSQILFVRKQICDTSISNSILRLECNLANDPNCTTDNTEFHLTKQSTAIGIEGKFVFRSKNFAYELRNGERLN